MKKSVLKHLNTENLKIGAPPFANSRNAAAGSLRQLDSKLVEERHLDFFAYEVTQTEGSAWQENIAKHSSKHELLKKLGFLIDEHSKKTFDLKDILVFIGEVSKIRDTLPFGIDGVVININDTKLYKTLGVAGKDPRGIIAFKYPAERATTMVKDIKINVGRTGVLTPLAIFTPTLVAGSTVSKATLHNMDQIERLGLRIGDTVVIEKAGDVIPKVVEVLTKLRSGKEKKFKIPKNCPACGGKIVKKGINEVEMLSRKALRRPTGASREIFQQENIRAFRDNGSTKFSVAYYCINPKCGAKNERYLEHFVSVFEIYELGPKILRRFKDESLITDAADIFTLTTGDIALLERFGEKSAENIVNEIKMKKKIELSKFLWALGILHVGEETARDLADSFGSLGTLEKVSEETINDIENIGPAVSRSVYEFFHDRNNLNFIRKLKHNGVIIQKPEKKKDGKWKGLSFVLTGTLSTMSREQAKQKVIALGGKVSGSVSKNTSYVLAGAGPGSKFTNAEKLGVKIISEEEFLKMSRF